MTEDVFDPFEGLSGSDLDAIVEQVERDEQASRTVSSGPAGKMVYGRNPATGRVEQYDSGIPDMPEASAGGGLQRDPLTGQVRRVRAATTTPTTAEGAGRATAGDAAAYGAAMKRSDVHRGWQSHQIVHIPDEKAQNPNGTQPFMEVRAAGGATPSLHLPNGTPAELVEVSGQKYLNVATGFRERPRWVAYDGPAEPVKREPLQNGPAWNAGLEDIYGPHRPQRSMHLRGQRDPNPPPGPFG